MKKIKLFCLTTMLMGATALQAQTEITAYDERTGEDEVIDVPESMDYDLDALLNEWNARQYLTPSGDCNMSETGPVYSKEEYMERLRKLPNVIEMPYNDVVQKFIDQYTGRLRRSVSYILGASNFYVPIFEEALDAYNLPLELKYLPVIESALNPKATSRAGAVGLWQFMLSTGKRYDLEVTSLVDDRCDPYKASYAAARYLKDLYAIYGDWNLVVAAYNCGPGNVNKAIHRAGGVRDYWAIYPYLPRETRGYVPAFIAANYIMNYYCEHNICPMTATLPVSTDTIVVNRDVHFQQIADVCNMPMDEVKTLNPQYRTGVIPGSNRPCTICLPQAALNAFIDAKDAVYTYRADELLTRREEVPVAVDPEPTPTVSRTRYQDSAPRASRATSSRKVRAREARRTRNARAAKSISARRGKKTRATRSGSVTVRKGETMSEIARRNGTTVKNLQRLNRTKGTKIEAGQKIRVK